MCDIRNAPGNPPRWSSTPAQKSRQAEVRTHPPRENLRAKGWLGGLPGVWAGVSRGTPAEPHLRRAQAARGGRPPGVGCNRVPPPPTPPTASRRPRGNQPPFSTAASVPPRGRAAPAPLKAKVSLDDQKDPRMERGGSGVGGARLEAGEPEKAPTLRFSVPGPRGRGGGLCPGQVVGRVASHLYYCRLLHLQACSSCSWSLLSPSRRRASAGTKDRTCWHLSVGEAWKGHEVRWCMLGWKPPSPGMQDLGPRVAIHSSAHDLVPVK